MYAKNIFYSLLFSTLIFCSCQKKTEEQDGTPLELRQGIAVDTVARDYNYSKSWNQKIDIYGSSLTFDLNNDGQNDVTFSHRYLESRTGSSTQTHITSLDSQCYISSLQRIDSICTYSLPDPTGNLPYIGYVKNYPPKNPNPLFLRISEIDTSICSLVLHESDSLNTFNNWSNQPCLIQDRFYSNDASGHNNVEKGFWNNGILHSFVGIKLIDAHGQTYLGWIEISISSNTLYIHKSALKRVLSP